MLFWFRCKSTPKKNAWKYAKKINPKRIMWKKTKKKLNSPEFREDTMREMRNVIDFCFNIYVDRVFYSAHSMLQGQEYKKDTNKTLTFSHYKNWFFQTKFRWIRLHKNRIQIWELGKCFIFHLQSKCFFFGPIISSVVALHTDLAKPCPAKLCRAANNLSFIVCPAIFFSFSYIFGSITLYFSFTYTTHTIFSPI